VYITFKQKAEAKKQQSLDSIPIKHSWTATRGLQDY